MLVYPMTKTVSAVMLVGVAFDFFPFLSHKLLVMRNSALMCSVHVFEFIL